MSGQLRVVIVDDTPDMRLLVRLSLELDPHIDVVAEGADGRAAIDLAERHRPDVMLLDLAMPVMDGMQALPQVVRRSPGTAVLVLSGFSATAMRDEALAAGAAGYVQKGIVAEELCERVWAVSGRERPARGPEVIPTLPLPAEPRVEGADRVEVAAARAAEAAPSGLVVLDAPADRPAASWTVRWLNDRASELLGLATGPAGARVGDLLPDLAGVLDGLVARPREDARVGAVRVRASRTGDEVVLSLDPSASDVDRDDVERLRTALARTAHELRNPVAVLVGISEAVRVGYDRLSDGQRDHLRAALRRQSDILQRLTNDLVTAVQVERGGLSVELEAVDVAAVVRACLDQEPADQGSPVTVRVDGEVTALADPARLTQVVTNLLSNARKYADPPYDVRVAREGDQVVLSFADRGDGVPEAFRPRLFEEFTRAGTDARGTGLGLFVVRSLAEAQGGSVDHRPREGGGSVFTVRLPAS
ncbi:ATP-binding response regulator [Nocardioides marmoribigeumensis]|uniref:histidine kinase n=1 Tax=Nocardioides marmoribigeumensis TaxID=433649 RepID=A0ABU2BZ38_9ACTN|nr:response regulator [Nocardioides marmoribigeumensis]MDR7363659.1 signal transduction histidine kinase [Nocardioides marmoribigeumensis]